MKLWKGQSSRYLDGRISSIKAGLGNTLQGASLYIAIQHVAGRERCNRLLRVLNASWLLGNAAGFPGVVVETARTRRNPRWGLAMWQL